MTDESMRRPTADGQRKASGTGFTLEDIVGAYSGAAFQTDGAVKPNTNAAVPKVTAEEIVSAETVPHAEEYRVDIREGGSAREAEGAEAYSSFDFSDPQAVEKFADEVSRAISGQEEAQREEEELRERFSIFRKRSNSRVIPEDEVELPEPDMKTVLHRYEKGMQSAVYRSLAAFVLCVVMVVFTFVAEAGKALPFGIDTDSALTAGALAMLQVIVMMLCIEIPIQGITDLIRLRPGAESLAAVSAIVSLAHAMVILAGGGTDSGLPYCAVAAFAVWSGMRGHLFYRMGMRSCIRGATAGENPYGVICEFADGEDKAVLRKVAGMQEGFYRNLTSADISEQLYSLLAPFFVIGAVVLALLASVVSGNLSEYIRGVAALLAVSASFSAFYAYNLPFRKVSKGARTAGGIVAGWGGAAEIADSDCVILTDTDLFPKGTVSLNGYKVFEHADHSEGVAHTASLIIASGSELAPIFKDLLKTEGLPVEPVEEFSCYEGGGIGATIRGDKVFAGTAAFMHLQGIRIPESVNITNAVYTVINGRLSAVFAMNYEPMTSVQGALLTILRMKLGMFFGVRDFNLTPTMIQQRYKVNVEGGRYLPVEDCYRITGAKPAEHCRTDALLTREGLGAFSEAVMRGRHLKVVSELAAVLAALGSIIGFVIVFILLAGGAFESAAAGNLLIFMLAVHALVLLIASLPQRPR